MDIKIFCKNAQIVSCFDGYVQVDLTDVDESRFEYVDRDDIDDDYPQEDYDVESAIKKLGMDALLVHIGRKKIMDFFGLTKKE